MRKTTYILFTFFLFFFSKSGYSQREAENWVYGYSVWLNFSTGQPVQQPQIPVAQFWGSTCMSNRNGQLLFYGNGAYLYDRLHQTMPGGGLFGNNDIYSIFETKDIRKGWDGNIQGLQQPNGVYVWMIRYKTVTDSREQLLKGTLTLIR